MNIYDFMMIFATFLVLGVIFFKIYNLLNMNKVYGWKMAVMLFCIFLVGWFITFITFMIQPERTIFKVLFQFGNLFMVINTLLFAIEIIWLIVEATSTYRPRYIGKSAN